MIALLFLVAVIFALALLFAWLAERPGTVTLDWLGQEVSVGLITAIAGILALIAVVMLAWWIIKGIVRAPAAIVDQQRGRKRDKGYRALSQGMLALGAGDVAQARTLARQADRRLGHTREPMVLLLEAQTALAEDKHDEARGLFDEMLESNETRPLGLRGLFLEAQREGEHEAARHYAERAAALSPNHLWATDATLEYATLDGDFDKALSIVEDQQRAKSITKDEAQRKRLVLLTAKSMAELDANPSQARDLARQAHKIDPAFVPATLAEARAHTRLDDPRKATKVLEDTWKREPHPDIADAYIHARSGDSAAERLKRAQRLDSLKSDHVESHLAVAHAALDAHDVDLARERAEAALKEDPREGVFLLLADIEEAQTGDGSRVRHWLQSALRAPRDPAWVADGHVSERWAPISPITGRFDAFKWERPLRNLDGLAIDVDDALAMLPGTGDAAEARDQQSDAARLDAEDAEFVEVVANRDQAERIARDSDRGRMVAVDSSAEVPGGNTEQPTVITGSDTAPLGRLDESAAAKADNAANAAAADDKGAAPSLRRGTAGAAITTPPTRSGEAPVRAAGSVRQGVDLKERTRTRPSSDGTPSSGASSSNEQTTRTERTATNTAALDGTKSQAREPERLETPPPSVSASVQASNAEAVAEAHDTTPPPSTTGSVAAGALATTAATGAAVGRQLTASAERSGSAEAGGSPSPSDTSPAMNATASQRSSSENTARRPVRGVDLRERTATRASQSDQGSTGASSVVGANGDGSRSAVGSVSNADPSATAPAFRNEGQGGASAAPRMNTNSPPHDSSADSWAQTANDRAANDRGATSNAIRSEDRGDENPARENDRDEDPSVKRFRLL